jgi:hypothetical protein
MKIVKRQTRTKRRKQTSLIKADFLTRIPLCLTDILIIPTTTHEIKEPPPRTVLKPMSCVPLPLKETSVAKTSLAPLPRERRVTPAIVGESLKTLERLSREGQKYSEAVLARR